MNTEKIIQNKINIADKRIKELNSSGDIKKLQENEANQIAQFYIERSANRLETAKLIKEISSGKEQTDFVSKKYNDYGECVSAAYYAMYYIVHAYLAKVYKTRLREDVRGVHAITTQLILYYLVKTERLARHLYDEYQKTLGTVAKIQNFTLDDFQSEAYKLAEKYDQSRDARETFTYKVTKNAEERYAQQTIEIAEEFINTIRRLM